MRLWQLLAIAISLSLFASSCAGLKNPKTEHREYTPVSQELFDELARMDSIVFTAVNTGDYETIAGIFTKDLEFFHDKAGLSNYAQNMEATRNLLNNPEKVRRELVPGSLEVYEIPGYGAIQLGEHRFYQTPPGKPERLGGTFKFLHIWKKVEGEWKISRVVSYDH